MYSVLSTIIVLGLIGLAGAALLYFTARRFAVHEDPRISAVESHLAGANCGGCGFSGCHAFASECVRRGNLDGMRCPASSEATMQIIADILGCRPAQSEERQIAVLQCNGSCASRPKTYRYDGAHSCAVMDAAGVGTSGCSYGCLGCGDCVGACPFGAITLDGVSGLPKVDTDKCTGCGKCTSECPRHLLELRPAGDNGRRVWVACANRDRGAIARKLCAAACIGCGKCLRTCSYGAVQLTDNLSHIDHNVCRACGECASACPTGAILTSFAPPAQKAQTNA